MIDINKEQRRASNPFSSCWVSASAGSGKTKVLIDRVLRLLLQYGDPDKILCLTFTKTAAANMAGKINQILKKWAIMPQDRLVRILTDLMGEEPEEETVHRAQCLFASLLDEAQPIKMMTIHSFCQSILKRFPLEAGISPNFEVIDEQKTKEILLACLKNVQENPSFKIEIATLSEGTYEKSLMDLFSEVLSKRIPLQEMVSQVNSLQDLSEKLKEYLQVSSFNSKEEIILSQFSLEEFEEKRKTYLTKKDYIYKRHEGNDEAYKVLNVVHHLKNWTVWHETIALLRISLAVLTQYEAVKKADSLLDYDDLIYITKNLLEKNDMASWVLFKLDGGIDHILVDEAQDTNFQQWGIIKMLTEEFFAGMGRSEKIRTIFAVGDKKQSIFSFQGAEPDAFEAMHHLFEQRVIDSENEFETVPLNLSFRSTKPILDLVNFLLKNKRATKGILWPEDTDVTHLAWRKGVAGKVEIWPLVKNEKKTKTDFFDPLMEYDDSEISSITKLAQKVASKIATMIGKKEMLLSENRPVKAGDFLILFQRRSALMTEIVRALKEANVPVVGIDRLKLTTHIAIEDLISLADFCLLPADDLSLACVLKSPLFNLSEEELFQLSAYRGETLLKERLKEKYPDIYSFLNHLIELATVASPFSFFTEILSTHKGRQKFKERLGEEVEETLDEFLNLILSFQQGHPRSLSVFMHWLKNQGNDIEIKRDLEQDDINAVHIMTVHASKGLQGKIVFLPDTLYVPNHSPKFIQTPLGFPLWLSKTALKTPLTDSFFETLKEKRLEEYRRLLYVALTRASDMLFICGAEGGKAPTKGNWYELIMESIPYEPDSNGVISFETPQTAEVSNSNLPSVEKIESTLPDWAIKKAPAEPTPFKPLKPSHALQKNVITTSPLQEANEKSLQFGTFIHRLLAYLPDVPADQRRKVALSLKPNDMDIPENIFTLLESKKFAFLFQKNSLAEVPVMGMIDNQVVSGQIDRLVVEDNQVLIIDYKTNSVVPSLNEIPLIYRTQLSYYKRLISDIFPDKIIKTYLLWTKTLELMEIK